MAISDKESSTPDLNYFVATLGQAAKINEENPHTYRNVNQFLDEKAKLFGENVAVGWPVAKDGKVGWGSEVLSFRQLRDRSIDVATRLYDDVMKPDDLDGSPGCVALLASSSMDFLLTWLGLMRLGYSVLLIAPQCQPSAINHLCKSCDASVLFFDDSHAARAFESATSFRHKFRTHPVPDTKTTPTSPEISPSSSPTIRSSIPVYHPAPHDIAYIHHTSGTTSGLPKPIPQSHHAGILVLPELEFSPKKATFTTTPLYHGGIADCFRSWSCNSPVWLFPGDRPITSINIIRCLQVAAQAASSPPNSSSSSKFSRSSKSANSGSSASSGMHGDEVPEIKYFSSVPYVLQMLAEDDQGLDWLRSMDIVGVGGASLPKSVGDGLVQKGVHLISRFGSAECGFLMNSHRNYTTDKEWQYLRLSARSSASGENDRFKNSPFLEFEEQEHNDSSGDGHGLCELVVKKGWPHMAKTNRDDGSFATADLFEKHPTIKGAWKYCARKDSVITLLTGKKFDPSPIEDSIVAAAPSHIKDVLIFGNSRPFPGLLVVGTQGCGSWKQRDIEKVHGIVEQATKETGQEFMQIARNMVVFLPPGTKPLEKSSKGTLLRGAAEKRFVQEIDDAYNDPQLPDSTSADSKEHQTPQDDEIKDAVRNIVHRVLGKKEGLLKNDDDFYRCGVDSAKCVQIRALIQREVVGGTDNDKVLPFNVVYDSGNIDHLSEYLLSTRRGHLTTVHTDAGQEMLDSVELFSNSGYLYSKPVTAAENAQEAGELSDNRNERGHTVLLTGATGSLGTHILHLLRETPSITQVVCLVRAPNDTVARQRVSNSLCSRNKPPLANDLPKITCLASDLSEPSLGLDPDILADTKAKASIIIHAAWPVNFSLPLRSFEDSLKGLRNLLDLCCAPSSGHQIKKKSFLFCSSTASVLGTPADSEVDKHMQKEQTGQRIIRERISRLPQEADKLGYSRSKWVAENICNKFYQHLCNGFAPGQDGVYDDVEMAILRIGQLTADRQTGIWNMSEAWPLMLSAGMDMGCFPRLPGDDEVKLDWLPVDECAKAVAEIALAGIESGNGSGSGDEGKEAHMRLLSEDDDADQANRRPSYGSDGVYRTAEVPVYHLVNNAETASWRDLLGWIQMLQKREKGRLSDLTDVQTWLSRLEKLDTDHPAKALLGLWRSAYGEGESGKFEETGKERKDSKVGEEVLLDYVDDDGDRDDGDEKSRGTKGGFVFETANAKRMAPSMKNITGVDAELVGRIWGWLDEEVRRKRGGDD